MGLKNFLDFLEANKLRIILIWFFAFAAYRISRHLGVFSSVSWLDSPASFTPSIFDIIVFSASVLFFFYAYYFSFAIKEKYRIILIFFAAFFIFAGFTQLSKPHWIDAQGYYELAVLGAEKGPLYLIQNYHTLNTKWSPEFIEALKTELKRFGIYEFGMQKLRPEPGEPNVYASRIVKHPPLWPVVLSFFMIFLGTGKTQALVVTWSASALVFVVIYFLVKKHSNEKTAIDATFLFMSVPTFILSSSAPLLDNMLVFFVLLSAYFLFESISKNKNHYLFLSGIFCSFAIFTKFTASIVFILFILYLVLGTEIRKQSSKLAFFIIPIFMVSGIFMLLNYYFFLTFITAKTNVAFVTGIYSKGHFIDFLLSLYYLNYFGIPLVFLLILSILKNVRNTLYRKKIDAPFWLFVFAFVGFLLFYPIKAGIERHALPFFMLLFFPLIREIEIMKTERTIFVYIALIMMILQTILLVL